MIHSKAIDVLKTFSGEEQKQFSDFVRSPFHNKNKNLIKLFDVLKKYHPEYIVENETVYSKIYSGKEYNHNNMKKLMSEKFLLLEKFLIHSRIEKDNYNTDKYLLKEYGQRKQNELFLFKVKKIKENMEEVNYYTSDFHDILGIEDLVTEFYVLNNIINKIPSINYIKRSEYLLCYFLENILPDINDMLIGPRVTKFKEPLVFELFLKSWDMKSFLKYLSDNKIKNHYIVLLINLIMMFLYPENETYFKQAKHLLLFKLNNSIKENYQKFRNFIVLLENRNNMIYKREKKHNLELFELYKYHLRLITGNNDKIISIFYLNIINISLGLNDIEWVEEFIKGNTKYLEEKDKENTYNCAKALLEFAKQNYEESLSYASKISIRTSYYYKIEINILILKCYYELSLDEAALSLIDSTKHYLSKTEEIIINHIEHFKRILSIIYKLFKLKINLNNSIKSSLFDLRSEITNNAIRSEWYLQKVEELEQSIRVKPLSQKLKKSQSKKHLKSA